MSDGSGVTEVLDGIPLAFSDLSGWGAFSLLALYNVISFLKGWIFPKYVVEAFERQAAIWREAFDVSQVALREKDAATAELLQHSRTTVDVLKRLQEDAEREQEVRRSSTETVERVRRRAGESPGPRRPVS